MLFKLLTAVLAVALIAENVYILTHRHPANRFKYMDSHDGVVAFDTTAGQLCKTLRTRSTAEIELAEAESAKKPAPCPPPPTPSSDPFFDEIDRAIRSKRCVGNGEDVTQKSDVDSAIEFVTRLPACADIR